jgi:protein-disulfide isomerase
VMPRPKLVLPWIVVALVALMAAADDGAQMSVPPTPLSTNPADSPVRTQSGKVFASTDASRPPALGPAPAKVLVLVLSDFQCPVCRRTADATQQIAEEFPEEVRAEFWQHALPMHPNAENAAVASLAAQRQGKFWEYHDELFRNQSALDPASLARYAEALGLDAERFKSDYVDPELRARVKRESAFAETFGATGTPAFLINGKLYVGWGSWSSFRGNVERELAEARKVEAEGTPLAQVAETRARALITNPEQLQTYVSSVLPTDQPVSKKDKKKKDKKKKDKKTPEAAS